MDKAFELGRESFNIEQFQRFILVADIGGENSYFAVMGVLTNKDFKIILKYHKKTKDIQNLPETLNYILEETHKLFKISITRAVIAGAGAVSRHRNKLKLTSHNVEICTQDLNKSTLLLKFILINNFEAEGYGLDFLNKTKITKISEADIKSTITTSAILGAGHGLGASIMYHDTVKHLKVSLPSEAGHMSLPIELYLDLEYVNYLREKLYDGRPVPISSELAVSGKGVCHLYDFIISKKIYGEPQMNLTKYDEGEKIKRIFESRSDIYCKRAIELFVSYYAKAARNLAIATQPYSGLFLTGKVALASKDVIQEFFMKEFLNYSVHKHLLEKIPIFLINDDELTLYGACNVAVNFYNKFS
ncbi:MAG: glucokinase [Candidatus Woesearchaeota archaeon]